MIKVCDSIMGSGKTEAAITMINRDDKGRYLFVTPYLSEVQRIKERCASRNFKDPWQTNKGKVDSLNLLLSKGANIVSTHALFEKYNERTIELIREKGYTLVMDEAFRAIKEMPIAKSDVSILVNSNTITSKGEVPKWEDKDYFGVFNDIKAKLNTNNDIRIYGKAALIYVFPIEVFKAFKDIYILTYMFECSNNKYYFDLFDVEYSKISVRRDGEVYSFTDYGNGNYDYSMIRQRLHICDKKKLNEIGSKGKYDLSSSWFMKAHREKESDNNEKFERIKKNLVNYFRNICKAKSKDIMWTCLKDYMSEITAKGFMSSFVQRNARATNEYSDRHYLAYISNVFYNPYLKNYLVSNGVEVNEDMYAVSELVQWIWRSAIRIGEDVYIYLPSERMRGLLTDWLETLQ